MLMTEQKQRRYRATGTHPYQLPLSLSLSSSLYRSLSLVFIPSFLSCSLSTLFLLFSRLFSFIFLLPNSLLIHRVSNLSVSFFVLSSPFIFFPPNRSIAPNTLSVFFPVFSGYYISILSNPLFFLLSRSFVPLLLARLMYSPFSFFFLTQTFPVFLVLFPHFYVTLFLSPSCQQPLFLCHWLHEPPHLLVSSVFTSVLLIPIASVSSNTCTTTSRGCIRFLNHLDAVWNFLSSWRKNRT